MILFTFEKIVNLFNGPEVFIRKLASYLVSRNLIIVSR